MRVRRRQLKFLLYGPDQPQFLANQNNNNNNNYDFTYKHFPFYYLFFFWYYLFLLSCNKINKKQKFSELEIVESQRKEIWSLSLLQPFLHWWSIFLFFGVSTLKLSIIINILLTDRPRIILPTARTTKN